MYYNFSMSVEVGDTEEAKKEILAEARRVAALEGNDTCDSMLLEGGEVSVENCLVMIFDRSAKSVDIIGSCATANEGSSVYYTFDMTVEIRDTPEAKQALLDEARQVAALESNDDCDSMLLEGGDVCVENCLVMIFDRSAAGVEILESSASLVDEEDEDDESLPDNPKIIVDAFLAKAQGWQIHPSHFDAMRNANSDVHLKEAVIAFLGRIDTQGWGIHPSHLEGLRSIAAAT